MSSSTSTMIPPSTPFLPTKLYIPADQSLLLSTVPIWDQTDDSINNMAEDSIWATVGSGPSQASRGSRHPRPSTPHGDASEQSGDETFNLGDYLPDKSTTYANVDAEARREKRQGGDTPMKTHVLKKTKQPTPQKDDFYTRRVKDSDRRNSLGPKSPLLPETTLHRSSSQTSLYRSASHGSIGARSLTSPVVGTVEIDKPKTLSPQLATPAEPERRKHQSALARYLARDKAAPVPDRQSPACRSNASGSSIKSKASERFPTSSPPLESAQSASPRPTAPLTRTVSGESNNSTLKRSLRQSVGEVVAGIGGLLRRSISRSSLWGSGGGGDGDGQEGSNALVDTVESDESAGMEEASGVEEMNEGTAEAEEELLEHDSSELHAPRALCTIPSAPRFKLPVALTRPSKPLGGATATRAQQPRAPSTAPTTTRPILPKPIAPRPTRAPLHTCPTQTSFTSRALARLPPPGKGASSSSKPTTIRPIDRATDLAAKRERFETLARQAEEEKRNRLQGLQGVIPPPVKAMKRTIPVRGNTPGKASRARAEERRAFEQALNERQGERRRLEEEMKRAKEEMEAEEERVKRRETVVRANPVPGFIRGGSGEGGK